MQFLWICFQFYKINHYKDQRFLVQFILCIIFDSDWEFFYWILQSVEHSFSPNTIITIHSVYITTCLLDYYFCFFFEVQFLSALLLFTPRDRRTCFLFEDGRRESSVQVKSPALFNHLVNTDLLTPDSNCWPFIVSPGPPSVSQIPPKRKGKSRWKSCYLGGFKACIYLPLCSTPCRFVSSLKMHSLPDPPLLIATKSLPTHPPFNHPYNFPPS